MVDENQAQQPEKKGNKIKIIGIIVLVLIIVIVVLLWLLSQQPEEDVFEMLPDNTPAGILPDSTFTPSGGTSAQVGGDVAPDPESEVIPVDQRTSLKRLAMAFTERYGSYSNQTDFENLLDLTSLMSKAMASRTEAFIESARSGAESGASYAGTTTRSLSVELDSYDEDGGEATLTVSAQRRDAGEPVGDKIYYQTLTIEFIKVGESWKADSATWNEEEEEEGFGQFFPSS